MLLEVNHRAKRHYQCGHVCSGRDGGGVGVEDGKGCELNVLKCPNDLARG